MRRCPLRLGLLWHRRGQHLLDRCRQRRHRLFQRRLFATLRYILRRRVPPDVAERASEQLAAVRVPTLDQPVVQPPVGAGEQLPERRERLQVLGGDGAVDPAQGLEGLELRHQVGGDRSWWPRGVPQGRSESVFAHVVPGVWQAEDDGEGAVGLVAQRHQPADHCSQRVAPCRASLLLPVEHVDEGIDLVHGEHGRPDSASSPDNSPISASGSFGGDVIPQRLSSPRSTSLPAAV